MSDRIDTATEQKLIGCIKQVIGMVSPGGQHDPTAALVKVATEHDLTPAQVRRVGEMYNASRSIANHRQKQAEARCEPFQLADADAALAEMFPKTMKSTGETAVVTGLLQKAAGLRTVVPNFIEKMGTAAAATEPAPWAGESKAAAYPRSPLHAYKEQVKQVDHANLRVKQAGQDLGAVKIAFRASLSKAAQAVRDNFATTPFERVERAVCARYDVPGTKLAPLLYELSKAAEFKQQRLLSGRVDNDLTDWSRGPFPAIEAFMKAAYELHGASDRLEKAQAAVPPPPFPVTRATPSPNPFQDCEEKQADYQVGDVTRGVLDRSIEGLRGSLPGAPSEGKALVNAMQDVEDPAVRDQITRVKVQTTLADLLAHDPVIKTYDPQEVMDHYNELADVAPDVVDKPVLVRGILRRALQQGHLDPFEAGQVISTGKTLGDVQTQPAQRQLTKGLVTDPKSLRPDLSGDKTPGTPQGFAFQTLSGKKPPAQPPATLPAPRI
jgi:hypothetical protein